MGLLGDFIIIFLFVLLGVYFIIRKTFLFVINVTCDYKTITYESTNSVLNYERNEDSHLKVIILGGTYIGNSDCTKPESCSGFVPVQKPVQRAVQKLVGQALLGHTLSDIS